MKPFDEKFGKNVREVFDNYQEPLDEKAWQQMKTRLQSRSKTRLFAMPPMLVRVAAAAAFLILISGSIWLLVLNPLKPDMETSYKVDEDISADSVQGSGDTQTVITGQEDIITEVSPRHISSTDHDGAKRLSTASLVSERPEEDELIIHITDIPPVSDTREITDTQPLAELSSLSAISGLYSRVVTSYIVPSGQSSADANEFIISRNLERLSEAGKVTHRTSIMEVSAGSMKTWSPQEMAGGMGYTAGVTGDWHVSRRMSIHGGGLLVYNQFNLENTIVSAQSLSKREFSTAPATDINMGYQVLQYQTSDTEVEFTALDIPVNIRFTVREMPGSRIFLSAGFSSFLYLQQKYRSESTVLASYHRLKPQGHYVSESGSTNLTSGGEFSAFRRFDLARFLNISGGYMIRGRNQAIIVEPFLKYPLGDVTNLNLNIGMAGLSIKYLPGSR